MTTELSFRQRVYDGLELLWKQMLASAAKAFEAATTKQGTIAAVLAVLTALLTPLVIALTRYYLSVADYYDWLRAGG